MVVFNYLLKHACRTCRGEREYIVKVKNCRSVSSVVAMLLVLCGGLSAAGCTRNVVHVRELPVFEKQKVQVGTKTEPTFTEKDEEPKLKLGNGRIAIVPFSNASEKEKAGLAVAEEFEYWFIDNRESIDKRMKGYFSDREHCFIIVSRTKLSEVMTEQELTEQGKVSAGTATQLKQILSIEYILTGHIRKASAAGWSVIFKAIDTSTSEIAWSERIDANTLEELILMAGEYLLPHKVLIEGEPREVPVFEEQDVQTGTREEEYNEIVKIPGRLYVRANLGLLPVPKMLSLSPVVGIGAHWDLGRIHHRLVFQGGPTISKADGGEVRGGGQVVYSPLFLIKVFYISLDFGAGFTFSQLHRESGSRRDATFYRFDKRVIDVFSAGGTFGIKYKGFSIGTGAHLTVGFISYDCEANQSSICRYLFDVPDWESNKGAAGLRLTLLQVDYAF